MTIELSNYWAKLTGAVHPYDMDTFARAGAHGFNLEFPPPAFIGDITHAPVIILDNNGGYGPHITPGEFPDSKACDEFRQMLAAPRPVDPAARSMSLYYLQRNYSPWLISGEAALVNGLAYRSVDGNTLGVGKLTKALPSAQFHRNWLREILAPLAARGERFIVVHRWGRWNGAADVLRGLPSAVFSTCPIGSDLTSDEFDATQKFFARRERAHRA
jgi:hypothetical protein